MPSRVDLYRICPKVVEELVSFREFVGMSGLNEHLIELVKAYVLDDHGCAGAGACRRLSHATAGVEQRPRAALSWNRLRSLTERELAALAWSDCVTRTPSGVAEADYLSARQWFTEEELVDLTVIIVAMNAYKQVTQIFSPNPDEH